MAAAKKKAESAARATKKQARSQLISELEPDVRDQDPRPPTGAGDRVVVRAVGNRSELAWDGAEAVLGAAAERLGAQPISLALSLIERIRFARGGHALHARIDSAACSSSALRVRGPAPVIEEIAAAFREILRDPPRLAAEIAKADGEILRGWRPW